MSCYGWDINPASFDNPQIKKLFFWKYFFYSWIVIKLLLEIVLVLKLLKNQLLFREKFLDEKLLNKMEML